MIHLQQLLAQHWHLSASQYWQLRLLCTLTIGPLLGVLCLVLFRRRAEIGMNMQRRLRGQSGARLPMQPAAQP